MSFVKKKPSKRETRRSALERAMAVLGDSAQIGLQAALKEAAAWHRPSSGSPRMPSVHSTFAEEVAAFAGIGQRAAATCGKVSRGGGQDDRARPNRCRWGGPNSHTAREDLRDGRRAPSIEGAWQRWRLSAMRFGKNDQGLCQCAFPGFGWWRCVAARVALCAISVLASTRVRSWNSVLSFFWVSFLR